jgi:vacuolar protein sorting-associated protein 3
MAKLPGYAHDLITFYLDIVLNELESSSASRETLRQTYVTYRALTAPKPTYRQFLTENGLPTAWWHSRLRLLQLLGGSSGDTSYEADSMRTKLEPYESELVPEMIILNGKQGKHQEAIRLLTHGLGDFDTAISYCLLGGSSIFPTGLVPEESVPSREEQSRLFGYLLREFMRIEDGEQRMEQTGELLERFGSWFDVAEVLAMIPDDWEVEGFADFLVSSLRRLVHERQETAVARALYSARNLGVSKDLLDKIDETGPQIERGAA